MNKTRTLSEKFFKKLIEHHRYYVLCVYCCVDTFFAHVRWGTYTDCKRKKFINLNVTHVIIYRGIHLVAPSDQTLFRQNERLIISNIFCNSFFVVHCRLYIVNCEFLALIFVFYLFFCIFVFFCLKLGCSSFFQKESSGRQVKDME